MRTLEDYFNYKLASLTTPSVAKLYAVIAYEIDRLKLKHVKPDERGRLWFGCDNRFLLDKTGLSASTINNHVWKLVDEGLLSVRRLSLREKEFCIHESALKEFLSDGRINFLPRSDNLKKCAQR